MKHYISHNKDLLDSISILFIAGALTALFCTSNMTDSLLLEYSHVLRSTLIMPQDAGQFFLEQCLSHVLFCLLLLFLGFSLFGIPLIQFCVFLKGFQIGFSAYLFLVTYQLKGILGILFTLLPQIVFDMAAISIIAVSALQCSGMLISALTEHPNDVQLLPLINQKLNSFLISCSIALFSSAVKSTIGLVLIDYFIKIE